MLASCDVIDALPEEIKTTFASNIASWNPTSEFVHGTVTLPADTPADLLEAVERVTTAGKINLNSNGSIDAAGTVKSTDVNAYGFVMANPSNTAHTSGGLYQTDVGASTLYLKNQFNVAPTVTLDGSDGSADVKQLNITRTLPAGTTELIDLKLNGSGTGPTGDVYGIKADLTAPNTSAKLYGYYIESKAGTGQSTWGGYASAKATSSNQSAVGLLGEALVPAGAGQVVGSTAGVKGIGRNFTGPGAASKVIGVMAENLCDSGNTAWGFYGSTQTGAATVTPLELVHDDSTICKVAEDGSATFSGALEAESIDGGEYAT